MAAGTGVSDISDAQMTQAFASYHREHNPDAVGAMEFWSQWVAGVPQETQDDYVVPPEALWVFMFGTPGSGKSHFLAAAFIRLVERGCLPIYSVVPLLLDHIREGFTAGDYGGRFKAVREAPILLLDDLGSESRSAWTEQALFMLLDYRSRHRLPTARCSPAGWS